MSMWYTGRQTPGQGWGGCDLSRRLGGGGGVGEVTWAAGGAATWLGEGWGVH